MPASNHQVWIALGSNMGDRLKHLRSGALAIIDQLHDSRAEAPVASRIYETSPVGGPAGQSDFLNAVLRVRTIHSPAQVLHTLLDIERVHGRLRREPNDPRVLDLDILFYDQTVMDVEDLRIPHPRLQLRRFVLEPLCDIDPDLIHPRLGESIKSLLENLSRSESVRIQVCDAPLIQDRSPDQY